MIECRDRSSIREFADDTPEAERGATGPNRTMSSCSLERARIDPIYETVEVVVEAQYGLDIVTIT